MSEMILVIGATGMLGEPVARRLAADGFRVRVMTRRLEAARARFGEGFEVVGGDVDEPGSLAEALAGCHGVHINLAGGTDIALETRGAKNVSEAAAKAGVERITYISGASVAEENCWFPGTKAKFDAEVAIRGSGVGFTIFNASWFTESLPLFVRGKRAGLFGRQPNPFYWVAAEDYAGMVSRAYSTPEAANKALFIFGPEPVLLGDALETYCALVRPDVQVKRIPFWMGSLIAALGRKTELKLVLSFLRYCEKVREAGDPSEANALLGAPTTTLEAWCKKQAAAQTA